MIKSPQQENPFDGSSGIALEAENNKKAYALFRDLFYAYYANLHRYAFTMVKDNEVASDLVQTVFTNLWSQRKELLDEENIAGYLYKSVYNRSLNFIRDKKTRDQHLINASKSADNFTEDAGNKVLAGELSERITRILATLPPQCRLIFEKSRLENKRYAEIAEELQLSVKTVEAQIGKALRIFRKGLKDYL